MESDLSAVRRSFLDYVAHVARQPRPDHGLGGAYSRELVAALREHIDTVGDDSAWRDFIWLRDASGVDDLAANVLTLHHVDAWRESVADEIRRDLATLMEAA